MRRYYHVGIPTDTPRPGEVYLERFGLPCTEVAPAVAFVVDDLEAELAGHEVIIAPNSPSEGVLVAFILEEGAPVDLMQYS